MSKNKKDKKITVKKKKTWTIKDLYGNKVVFAPIFEVNEKNKEVETKYLEMMFEDKDKNKQKFAFNFLDIYMFIYFCSNEELRRTLMMRKETAKKVNFIPYEVGIKLSDDERKSKIVRRRIEVPIDALTMAIARNEAFKSKLGLNIIKGRRK